MPSNKIVATYKAATPVYLGNETPSTPATRLREASFKGVLRFWWRALFWQHCWEKAGGDEKHALALLKGAEGDLFGMASDNAGGRQARFYLRTFVEVKGDKKNNPNPQQDIGWKYLLGQGLIHRDPAFNAGSIFRVELLLRPGIRDEQEEQLLKALVALGLFGGIGARSRRGVGSLAIHEITDGIIPYTAEDLKKVKNWLGLPAKCPMPPFSAFSNTSSSIFFKSDNLKPKEIIRNFGCAFMNYRSYYKVNCDFDHHKCKVIMQKKKNPNFENDHDNMLLVAQGTPPSKAPKRAVFGIPHNYYYRSIKRGVEAHHPNYERRGSPYFIHSHIFQDNSSGIIHTLLPAPFPEPSLEVVQTKVQRGQSPFKTTLPFTPDWKVIRKFMNAHGQRFI